MLHELSKHRLAEVHPSLSAIDAAGTGRRRSHLSPEKVQIEKSQKPS
jgi:hypothetical protein